MNVPQSEDGDDDDDNDDANELSNSIIEGAARSKVSRSSASDSMSMSGSKSVRMYTTEILVLLVFSIFMNSFRIS